MTLPARSERWRAVRLAMGTAAALGLARFAYGLLVPSMRAELGWTLAQAGAQTTANGLGYLAGQARVGRASGDQAAGVRAQRPAEQPERSGFAQALPTTYLSR
jgi:hypothetical protein